MIPRANLKQQRGDRRRWARLRGRPPAAHDSISAGDTGAGQLSLPRESRAARVLRAGPSPGLGPCSKKRPCCSLKNRFLESCKTAHLCGHKQLAGSTPSTKKSPTRMDRLKTGKSIQTPRFIQRCLSQSSQWEWLFSPPPTPKWLSGPQPSSASPRRTSSASSAASPAAALPPSSRALP
jgi:hypothetical protein